MSKVCPICRSINCIVEAGKFGDGSPFFTCLHCHTDIRKERILPETIFHRITASPEMLAEKLVYSERLDYCYEEWYSTLFSDKVFDTKSEAIAATVARLNEVVK